VGHGQSIVVGRVGHPGRKPEFDALGTFDHTTGERKIFGPVEANMLNKGLGAGHVRNQAPSNLEHRHAGVGGDQPDVGTHGNLEAATQRNAGDRADNGRWHFGPCVGGLLSAMCDAAFEVKNRVGVRLRAITVAVGHLGEAAKVQAGTKGPSLARKNHCPHRGVGFQRLASVDQCIEHGIVECIHLFGPVQLDVGHAIVHLDYYAIAHRQTLAVARPPDLDAAGNLRVVNRVVPVALVALSLLLAACSPETSSTLGERVGSADAITPEPTVSIEDIETQPDPNAANVVIAPTPVPDGPQPLVIVSLLGETGVMRPIDAPAAAGVVAEIDRLNDAGGLLGRPIELHRLDTNSRASVGERLAGRLIDDPPDLIIASCDTEVSKPILDIARDNDMLTISPCADDPRYLTGALGRWNFTMGSPAGPRGAVAAKVALRDYGDTAIVLRDVTSPEAIGFCDGFERAFRELGGTVTYRDEFTYDTLEPVQDRLAERGGQSAFITLCSHVPGEVDAAPSIILILRTLGYQVPILAGSSVDQPGWFGDVPTLGELTFISWSSAFGNDPDDRINDLVRDVQQNGDTAGAAVSTILGAETVEAWARAVNAAKTAEPERVVSALGSFSNEAFSTGEISFVAGARMDTGRVYRVLRVVDGELSVVALEDSE